MAQWGLAMGLFFAYFILSNVTMVLIWLRRHHRIIIVRNVVNLTLMHVVSNMIVLTAAISLGFDDLASNCQVLAWLLTVLLPLWSFPWLLQHALYVYESRRNHLKVKRIEEGDNSFYLTGRRYLTLSQIYLLVVVLLALQIAAKMTIDYAVVPNNEPVTCLIYHQYSFSVFAIFYVSAASLVAYNLLFIHDPFYIRQQGLFGSILSFPFVLAAIVLLGLYSYPADTFCLNFGLIGLLFCLTFITAQLIPLLLTFSACRRAMYLQTTEDDFRIGDSISMNGIQQTVSLEMFEVVLNNSDLLAIFRQHMINTWCVENLLFWQAVQDYRLKERSQAERRTYAVGIWNEFLSSGSPLEVNIDDTARRDIYRVLFKQQPNGDLPDDLFLSAENAMLYIMRNDCFAQFLRSPACRDSLVETLKSNKIKSFNHSSHDHDDTSSDHGSSRKSNSALMTDHKSNKRTTDKIGSASDSTLQVPT